MKKNNLIVARRTRACTTDELDYLQHLLKHAVNPRKRLLKAILNVLVMWGAALLGLLFASGVLSYLAKMSEVFSAIRSFSYLPELAIFSSAFYGLFSTYRWLKAWEHPYPTIQQDINCAQVIDETYHVQEVCHFQDPATSHSIYFLKISELAVFVLYGNQDQDDAEYSLRVQKVLTLSRAPLCGYYLDHCFQDDQVTLKTTYLSTLPTHEWPLPDSWLAISWSQLTSNLNRNKSF